MATKVQTRTGFWWMSSVGYIYIYMYMYMYVYVYVCICIYIYIVDPHWINNIWGIQQFTTTIIGIWFCLKNGYPQIHHCHQSLYTCIDKTYTWVALATLKCSALFSCLSIKKPSIHSWKNMLLPPSINLVTIFCRSNGWWSHGVILKAHSMSDHDTYYYYCSTLQPYHSHYY